MINAIKDPVAESGDLPWLTNGIEGSCVEYAWLTGALPEESILCGKMRHWATGDECAQPLLPG